MPTWLRARWGTRSRCTSGFSRRARRHSAPRRRIRPRRVPALAAAYFTAGRMSQALQLLEQVRTEYAKTLGANHQVTLATTLTLANAYHSVDHLTDAARLLEDTVQRCEQSLPEADPLTAAARDGLAAMRCARYPRETDTKAAKRRFHVKLQNITVPHIKLDIGATARE